MIGVDVGERARPRVIGVVLIGAGLARAEMLRAVACGASEAGNVGERWLRQLRDEAGGETELCGIEARALVVVGLLEAAHAEAQVENLAGADGPHVIQANILGDPLLKTAGGGGLKEVVQELVQVAPAHNGKAMVRIVP